MARPFASSVPVHPRHPLPPTAPTRRTFIDRTSLLLFLSACHVFCPAHCLRFGHLTTQHTQTPPSFASDPSAPTKKCTQKQIDKQINTTRRSPCFCRHTLKHGAPKKQTHHPKIKSTGDLLWPAYTINPNPPRIRLTKTMQPITPKPLPPVKPLQRPRPLPPKRPQHPHRTAHPQLKPKPKRLPKTTASNTLQPPKAPLPTPPKNAPTRTPLKPCETPLPPKHPYKPAFVLCKDSNPKKPPPHPPFKRSQRSEDHSSNNSAISSIPKKGSCSPISHVSFTTRNSNKHSTN